MKLTDIVIHRWLDIPYTLHVRIRPPIGSGKTPTILLLHGIGTSGEAWQSVIEKLPPEYRIVTLDLLGFGNSPSPSWATYDAKRQARAVVATYLRLGIRGRIILVGHSLGALVAVEIAKRYPLLVRSLVLCSPPFYKVDEQKRRLLPGSDELLREMYRLAKKHPEQFIKISRLAVKVGLVNKSYRLTLDSAPTYMNALEATIINQTSLNDASRLKIPIHILYGTFDPIVVKRNLRFLAGSNPEVTVTPVLASHEIMGPFVKAATAAITEAAERKR